MNAKMNELFEIVNANAEMMDTNRMTTDEILENIHCGADEQGQLIVNVIDALNKIIETKVFCNCGDPMVDPV